jgi:hypothetical protein
LPVEKIFTEIIVCFCIRILLFKYAEYILKKNIDENFVIAIEFFVITTIVYAFLVNVFFEIGK